MLDKTYCASPACTGKCGRKLPDALKNSPRIWNGYFCDDDGEPICRLPIDECKNFKIKD
jgi:hypothetical protein